MYFLHKVQFVLSLGDSLEGEMNPSKSQGLRLTSKHKCTEGLADVVIAQLSLPRTPLKGKGLWELILGEF